MKQTLVLALILFLSGWSESAQAQRLNVDRLPEYIIVQTESGGLTGGISISLHWRKSKYRTQLEILERQYLRGRKDIRTLTDLFTYMSEIGFDYINAFEARSADLSNTRSNVVFRKKEELRAASKNSESDGK